MNKKGSLTDLLFMAVAIFVFGVATLLGYAVYSSFNTEIQTMTDIPADAKTASTSMVAHFPGVLDNSILFLAFGLGVIAFMLAAMVRVHPVFLFIYLIFLVIIVIICGALSNVYQEMAANDNLSGYAANLGVANALLTYLPIIVGVFGTILAIVMYKSWRESQ